MSSDSNNAIEEAAAADLSAMISAIDDMVRQGLVEVLASLQQQQQSAQETIEGLRTELARLSEQVAEQIEHSKVEASLPPMAMPVAAPAATPVATPIASVEPIFPTGGFDDWEAALLGPELCGEPYLARERQSLLAGVRGGSPPAQALAGQLLAFRACGDERRAQLLKEVGEAYYGWRPETARGEDAFREALIGFLTAGCRAIGINNTIELVRPGDRFDSKRHNSKSRGIEITEIYGWVVLRENGSVYTKASVAAK